MLQERIQSLLNAQLNRELASAYLYLGMAAHCHVLNMDGFAHWLQLQAQEELGHGMKIFKYLTDRGASIQLLAIDQPKQSFGSLIEIFESALDNEKALAVELESLAHEAFTLKDLTTHHFLNWFLEEQVEEIATCSTILDKLKLIKGEGSALLFLNEELKRRQPEAAEKQ